MSQKFWSVGVLALVLLIGVTFYTNQAWAQQNNQNSNVQQGKPFLEKMMRSKLTEEQQTQLKQAIESGNYDAWKGIQDQILKDSPFLKVITQENFARFAEMRKLEWAAQENMKKAQEIATELGLPKHMKGLKHPGKIRKFLEKGKARNQKIPNANGQSMPVDGTVQ